MPPASTAPSTRRSRIRVGQDDLQARADRRPRARRQADAAGAREGKTIGLMLPNSIGAAVSLFAPDVGRDASSPWSISRPAPPTSGRRAWRASSIRSSRRGPSSRRASSTSSSPISPGSFKIVYLEDVRATVGTARQAEGGCSPGRHRWSARMPPTSRPCDPVHLGLRGSNRKGSCSPIATCCRTARRPAPWSISAATTRCSTCCRCSTPSG